MHLCRFDGKHLGLVSVQVMVSRWCSRSGATTPKWNWWS